MTFEKRKTCFNCDTNKGCRAYQIPIFRDEAEEETGAELFLYLSVGPNVAAAKSDDEFLDSNVHICEQCLFEFIGQLIGVEVEHVEKPSTHSH